MRFSTLLVPVAALGLLAACGDNATSSNSSTAGSAAVAGTGPAITSPSALPKPAVKLPSATPTELVITDLTEGTGTGAVDGDTVVVHYVGVRSADGAEFDNSYDRGSPLSVTIGVGQVIKGWDQGLLGIKSGGRRQLDIPANLAYGDSPPSTDVIQPGDALSFVIDAVVIIPKSDPANAPVVSIPPTPNQTEQTFTDLIIGDGVGIEPGQTVAVQLLAFSAADGKQLDSSWETGTPLTFVPGSNQLPPGLEKAVEGMKVGGRRQVDIPFAQAFGEAGNSSLGLPASTDLIMVLDLIAVY
ncbi:MAG: FKBP-type peptidyl-prolyl cis-trans isomerase [Ilumatobacteraceae bacterium]|nr:FKBP-type peptidyl-prolyl cis-trans isomerase [Ilumatobacteraceae bacterium]